LLSRQDFRRRRREREREGKWGSPIGRLCSRELASSLLIIRERFVVSSAPRCVHSRVLHFIGEFATCLTHTLSLSLSRRRDRFAARWHAGGEKYCVARACASGKFSKRNDAYEREQTSSAFANFKSHRVHRCTIRRNKDLRCRREDHAALRTKVEQLRVFRSD